MKERLYCQATRSPVEGCVRGIECAENCCVNADGKILLDIAFTENVDIFSESHHLLHDMLEDLYKQRK